MNHDEATRFFDDLGVATESRPPIGDLLATGRVAERRRRRTAVLGSAAAVLIVMGGAAVVQQTADGDTDPPTAVAEVPVAPEGMRLVGMGRVVVAVPESWGTQALQCGRPTQDTVYFVDRAPLCGGQSQRGISSILLLDADTEAGREAAAFTDTDTSINGVPVRRGTAECPPSADCRFPFEEVVWVVEQDVVLAVHPGGDDGGVLDSLRVLPDEFTTVPYLPADLSNGPAGNLLVEAGLKSEESPALEMGTGRQPQYGTSPEAGTVVAVGSTVLLLTQRQTGLTEAQTASALQIVEAYRSDNPSADVRSAYARWKKGTVKQPNVGECTSGELLEITMFGSFPGIATSGTPGGDGTDGTVTRVLLTADARTKEVCLLGVGTGTVGPEPEYTLIWAAEGQPDPTADAEPDPEPDPASPDPAVSIDGQWTAVMTNITGDPMHRDTTFTISLGGGLMRGDDGCNDFGSYYSTSGPDRDLRFGSVESTLVGCDSTADFIDTLSQVRHVTGRGQKRYLHGENWGILMALELVGPWEDPPPSKVVDLPTSEWEPGNGGDGAGIGGVLSIDGRDCVYLDSGGMKTWAVWPRGYTAVVSQGTVHLLDAEVNEVAEQGDELLLGGGFTNDFTPLTGAGCMPEDGDVAIVQSNVDGSNS